MLIFLMRRVLMINDGAKHKKKGANSLLCTVFVDGAGNNAHRPSARGEGQEKEGKVLCTVL